jgi:hypothetical protein
MKDAAEAIVGETTLMTTTSATERCIVCFTSIPASIWREDKDDKFSESSTDNSCFKGLKRKKKKN